MFCDHPDHVLCQLTTEEAENLRLPEPVTLYITFDDGPKPRGTEETLDALKDFGIKASFMVITNSLNVTGPDLNHQQKLFMRYVEEGHTISDHSFNHMYHNSDSGYDKYSEVGIPNN